MTDPFFFEKKNPKKSPEDTSTSENSSVLAESKSGDIQHHHFVPSHAIKSERDSKKRKNFLASRAEDKKQLSYRTHSQLKALQKVKDADQILVAELSKLLHADGIEAKRLKAEEVQEKAAEFGLQNLKITQEMLQQIKQRIESLRLSPKQRPKRGPGL